MNILRSLRTSVLGLVFAVVAGAACSGSSDIPPVNADCSINTDCNNPLVCAFKRCHNRCTSSRDCPDKQTCVQPKDVDTGAIGGNICQLPDEAHCHKNSECPDTLICGIDGICRNQCDSDKDCLSEQVCSSHTCADLKDVNDAGMLMQVIDGGTTRDGIPLGSDAATLMEEGGTEQTDSGNAKTDANGQGGNAGNGGSAGAGGAGVAGTVQAGGNAGTVETGGGAGTGGTGIDSGLADVSVGNDATVDAGSDVSVNSCISQPNGTPCGTDMVCRNFTCVSCVSGTACPNPGNLNSCKAWKYTCATGFQVCQQSTDNAPDFSSCGNSYYCSSGQCLFCSAGGACTPANECHKGTVVCSADAGSVCSDTLQNATDDTPCQGNKVCASGVCVAASRTLTVNSGGGQTALIDALLTVPVQIKLADSNGVAVPNKTVTLVGAPGAGARPTTAVTDAQGFVSFSPRVGLAVGSYDFTVTGEGASAMKFSADATAPTVGTVFTVWNTDHAAASDGYPGPATLAHANGPVAFALASDGSIYMDDYSAGRVFKMSPQGALTLVAGTGASGNSGDGGPAISAQIGRPWGVALDEATSSLYIADSQNSVVRKVDLSTGLISTYAGGGAAPAPGYGDSGFRTAAVLANPTDVSVGPDGALYISDSSHNRIRRVAPNGIIDAWLSPGDCTDSAALTSCYFYGEGCAVTWDKSGAAFIAGQICGTSPGGTAYGIIRKPATGPITHVTGHAASGASAGEGVPATLAGYANAPRAAFDDAGNLFVSAYAENKIRRIDGTDTRIKTIAGDGTATYGGDYVAATTSKFYNPSGMVMLPGGHLLIADYNNHAARVIWGAGTSTPSVVALSISSGNNQSVRPDEIAPPLSVKLVDGAAVPKAISQALVQWSVIDPGGALYSPTSTTGLTGIGSATVRPGLAVGAYHFQARVLDLHGQDVTGSPAQFTVNAIAPSTGDIFTVANSDHSPADDGLNGPGILAHIRNPEGVAVASDGTIYFADHTSHRVLMLTPKGVLVPIAGNGTSGYSGDPGPGTSAQLSSPSYLALDEANGFLFISDTGNNRIRVVELASGDISNYAGGNAAAPTPGFGDSGPATSAALSQPGQIVINPIDGALYVSDSGHNRIRKIGTNQIISAFFSGSQLTGASCNDPVDLFTCGYGCGIAFDASGNAYISGWACGTSFTGNIGGIVKRAVSNGAITLIGGHAAAGSNSIDGADATAYNFSDYTAPFSITMGNGDLYVAMSEFNRIVRLNLTTSTIGKVNYIAGDGTANYLGDYSPATAAQLKAPQGVAWMTGGHIVIGDYSNSSLRMIW